MAENKFPELEGIIYAKPTKTVIGKKGENKGKEMVIPSIVLEFKYNGSAKAQILSFNLARNVPIDDFGVKDHVVITYATESVPWKDDYITRARAIYIRHADVDYNDTKDLRPQHESPQKETVFVPPSPNEDELENLPF